MTGLITQFIRSEHAESVHRGYAVAVDPRGEIIQAYGDPDHPTYVRSSAKPFQGMAIVRSGAKQKFGFTRDEMAVMCASHNAEQVHVEVVQGILNKIGLSETAFDCGAHPPIDKAAAKELIQERREPTAIHNNCSGKHSGMLATALALGADPENYLDQDHPVQKLIHEIVCEYTDETSVFRGVDGCSAPVFWLPLKKLALAFARLASQETDEQQIIFKAMNSHPYMVAGRKRLDTEFMQQFPEELVSKGGGEAVYGAGFHNTESSFGLAVKVLDGNARALGPMILKLLDDLGVMTAQRWEALNWFWKPEIKNVIGRTIGTYNVIVED